MNEELKLEKNIFGADMTNQGKKDKNIKIAGNVFITKTLPLEAQQLQNEYHDEIEDYKKQYDLPKPLSVIKVISTICAYITFLFIVISLSDKDGIDIDSISVAGIIFGISLAIVIFIKFYYYKRTNKISTSHETEVFLDKLEQGTEYILNELGIPDNAYNIDILFEKYKIKKGRIKSLPMGLCSHANFNFSAFVRDNHLCLSDRCNVYEIPLSSFEKVTLPKQKVSFFDWYKKEQYDKGKYKKYKIVRNGYGFYISKAYKISIHDEKGDFFLRIPVYEEEDFSKLTGIQFNN